MDCYLYVKIFFVIGWSSEMFCYLYEDEVYIGIICGNLDWKGVKEYLFIDFFYLVDLEIERVVEVVNIYWLFI